MAPSPDSEVRGSGLAERSRELKAAIIGGDHAQAEQAVTGYVEALQHYWESLAGTERDSSPVPARARELLTWAREMTLIQRSLTADQLTVLQKASRYQGPASPYAGLQVEG